MQISKKANSYPFLFIVIISISVFLFSQLIFVESLQSQTKNSKIKQESLQHEVTVTLKLIQVYVTDKKGSPVTDLNKSDFVLYDNRKLKKITDFEKHILSLPGKKAEETKPPITPEVPSRMNRKFFLIFDLAFNNEAGFMNSKKVALHFIDTQLHPTDEVGILSYSATKGLALHEYLTSDFQKVRQVIEEFGTKKTIGRAQEAEGKYWQELAITVGTSGERGKGAGSEISRRFLQARSFDRKVYKNQASNFYSVFMDVAKTLRYIPGYKHLILFSGGVAGFAFASPSGLPGSLQTQYENLSKELRASNSPVYAVNSVGTSYHLKSRDMWGKHSLSELANRSGGKYFDNIVNLEKIMEDIQNATCSYYVLGYYIDEKWDGKYHEVKVKVKRKGCKVYRQGGYFNPKPFTNYTETEKMLHLIDLALSKKPHFQDPLHFPLIVLPYSVKEKSHLVVLTKITTERIKEVLGRKVEIVTLFFDRQDNIVELKRDEVSAFKLARDNVYFYSSSILSPGEYNCGVVIRNLDTGKGATASSSVIAPESPDSGIILYPPLLLIPEKNAFYLKGSATGKKEKQRKKISLLDIYPFPYTQYSPLVEGLNQGTSKLLTVVRCSTFKIEQPEILLSGHFVHLSSGKKIPFSLSVLNQSREENTEIFLAEIPVGELKLGKYSLHLVAEEVNTKSESHISITFFVK